MSRRSVLKRKLVLAASIALPVATAAALVVFAPRKPLLLLVPAATWAGFFFWFAWLTLKDPGYYDR